MNLKGDYEGSSLNSILQLLCDDQRTGILRVTSGEKQSRVVFKEGTIVYAIGSHKEARLGAILRRDGVLSEEHLKKCLLSAKETKQALGKVLVNRGYISLETLKKYNKKQVEEILYNLLFWRKGEFEYSDSELNLSGMIITQLNPMRLILEASRRIDEMSMLTEMIPSDQIIFKISDKPQTDEEEIKFSPNEWRILSLIDGIRPLRQIIEITGYDEFAVYKIVYSIMSYGLIEKMEGSPVTVKKNESNHTSIISFYSAVFQVIEKFLSADYSHLTATLFEECKNNLSSPYRTIVADFQVGTIPGEAEIDTIHKTLTEVLENGMQHNLLLIDSFNALCRYLISEISLLGKNPVQHIIAEIKRLLAFVETYPLEPIEKIKITTELKQICREVQAKLDKLSNQ